MSEVQPNPENFQPDIAARDLPERPFVPVEFYKHFQLADDILRCSKDTLTDLEIGFVARRDEWENAQQPLVKYDLFENRDEYGRRYFNLHVVRWAIGDFDNYAFADWGRTKLYKNSEGVQTENIDSESLDRQLMPILRARHQETSLGRRVEGYDEAFLKIKGWSAAEAALDHEFAQGYLIESRASDATIRNNAYRELYSLSKAAGFTVDEQTFRSSLQDILSDRRQSSYQRNQDSPVTPTRRTYEQPDFSMTPRVRKNPLRRFKFFRR